jgi:hypothetical protein
MENGKMHYYRIYDDKEEFNYVKCKLTHKEFEEVIYEYEKRNEKYLTDSLLEYLKRKDPEAELFHLEEISY